MRSSCGRFFAFSCRLHWRGVRDSVGRGAVQQGPSHAGHGDDDNSMAPCSLPRTAPTSGWAGHLDQSGSRRQHERSTVGNAARPVTGAAATRAAPKPRDHAKAHGVQRVAWPTPHTYYPLWHRAEGGREGERVSGREVATGSATMWHKGEGGARQWRQRAANALARPYLPPADCCGGSMTMRPSPTVGFEGTADEASGNVGGG